MRMQHYKLTSFFCLFQFNEHMNFTLSFLPTVIQAQLQKIFEKSYVLDPLIEVVKAKTSLSKNGTHPHPHIIVV